MKKNSFSLFLFLILVEILSAQTPKTYYVKRTLSAITIDGKLNEQDWIDALATDTFRYVDSGAKTSAFTFVKALWNDNYLYIAFIARDSSIWSDVTRHDGELWTRDVAELFIDTKGDSTNYAEIGIGLNNVYYDYIFPEGLINNNWKVTTRWNLDGLKFKAALSGTLNDNKPDTGWVVEIAIPFNKVPAPSTIHLPKAGEMWRVNFCRIDFNYKDAKIANYYAWNSTGQIAFHKPSKFGKLIFDSKPVNNK